MLSIRQHAESKDDSKKTKKFLVYLAILKTQKEFQKILKNVLFQFLDIYIKME